MAKRKNYDAVREFLCMQRMDNKDANPKCLTSKSGKCPLADFYCYEYRNADLLLEHTPPNGKGTVIAKIKELAKQYGIEVWR